MPWRSRTSMASVDRSRVTLVLTTRGRTSLSPGAMLWFRACSDSCESGLRHRLHETGNQAGGSCPYNDRQHEGASNGSVAPKELLRGKNSGHHRAYRRSNDCRSPESSALFRNVPLDIETEYSPAVCFVPYPGVLVGVLAPGQSRQGRAPARTSVSAGVSLLYELPMQ